MRPLGRKYYKNKTGGKHKHKVNGVTSSWWETVCSPNKTKEKRLVKNEIYKEAFLENDDVTRSFPEIVKRYPNDKVDIQYNWCVGEYCIYVNNKWKGYVEI